MTENKQRKEKLRKKYTQNFGQPNVRQWKEGDLEKISRYSKLRNETCGIDELTWLDLDMNEVYRQMAYTRSSLGDDYLYDLLRNPVKEETILQNREKKITSLTQTPEARISLQVIFAQLGRIPKYSFAEYL